MVEKQRKDVKRGKNLLKKGVKKEKNLLRKGEKTNYYYNKSI